MRRNFGSGEKGQRVNAKRRAERKPFHNLTRREWLARVGEAAALLGVRGAGWDEISARAAELARRGPRPLPVGLYQPSLDCLTIALENDGRYHPVPPGTETDYVQPGRGPYEPLFFTASEFKTVRRLVRLALGGPARGSKKRSAGLETFGETCEEIAEWIDLTVAQSRAVREAAQRLSPLHRSLAIHYYGAEAVHRIEQADPQKTWHAGLDWLKAESRRRYGRSLSRLSGANLQQLLELMSEHDQGLPARNAGTELFSLLKAEVVRGYYTSRRGLQELGYKGHAFYAVSPGCPPHQGKKEPQVGA